jgi:hypothetical protein
MLLGSVPISILVLKYSQKKFIEVHRKVIFKVRRAKVVRAEGRQGQWLFVVIAI